MQIISPEQAAHDFTPHDIAVQLGAQGFDPSWNQLSPAARGRAGVMAAIIEANPAGGTFGNFAGYSALAGGCPVPEDYFDTEACMQVTEVDCRVPDGIPDTWGVTPKPEGPFDIKDYAGTLVEEGARVAKAVLRQKLTLGKWGIDVWPKAYVVGGRRQLQRFGDATRVMAGVPRESWVGVQNDEGEEAGLKELVTRLGYRVAVVGLARRYSLAPEELVEREKRRVAAPINWVRSHRSAADDTASARQAA